MRCRLRPIRILLLALAAAAANTLAAAQMVSKAGHITIIAIMPETLSLSINVSSLAYSVSAASAPEKPGVAVDVTTAWSLMPGRNRVATLATMNHGSTPVIVSTVLPVGVGPLPHEQLQDTSMRRGFAIGPSVSSTQMSGTRLTDTNRRGASTAALPDSMDPAQPQQAPANTPSQILKIQVQPVL